MFENVVPTSPCEYSWRVNPCREGTCSELALDPLPTLCRKMSGITANSSGGRRIVYRRVRCWSMSRNSFRRITNTLPIRASAPSSCSVAGSKRFTRLLHQFHVHFLQGLGGGLNRADVCACLHECPHERRMLIIGMLQADGQDALGGGRIPDERQATRGLDPLRGISGDAHLGPCAKHATP